MLDNGNTPHILDFGEPEKENSILELEASQVLGDVVSTQWDDREMAQDTLVVHGYGSGVGACHRKSEQGTRNPYRWYRNHSFPLRRS